MTSLEIVPVDRPSLRRAFLYLPFQVYREDPHWIPPLLRSERRLLDRRVHPFHRHAEVEYYLARRDGRWAGRIAAAVNHEHLKLHADGAGFWGFFEAEDAEASKALLGSAEAFLRGRGMRAARGPMNFSVNETCGLLVEGFDTPPYILMPHNPPAYAGWIEGAGYSKAMDLLAYHATRAEVTGEPLRPAAEKVQAVKGVSFRRIDPRRLREEIKLVNGLFNDAWSSNWGFVPMTEEELEFMADELKPVFDPRLSFVAEVGGEPIAFAVALPNVNPVLKKMNGRLFPFGWWHFLTGRKSIDSFRVCLLGVRKDHQRSGIGILSCLRMVKAGLEAGARAAEMSWILETNRAMLAPLDRMGAKPYKRYRIFEKSLTP